MAASTHKSNRYTTYVTAFGAVGSITYGYAASIIGQVIGQPQFYKQFNLVESGAGLSHTNEVLGAMNGLFFAGGCLGCLFIAHFAEVYGRLRNIQLSCVICIFGAALMTGAKNVPMYLASRFIMGWGVGMMVCGVPLYQGELSPPKSRGFHVGLHGIALGLGYALTGFVGFGCYYDKTSPFQWRFPFAVQLIPVLILLSGSRLMPESPRWLLSKGRRDEAWQTLLRLHSDPSDPDDTFARREFYQMTQQFELDTHRQESLGIRHWYDFFRSPQYRRRLVIGVGATMASCCSGNLVVNNYQVTLYGGLGIKGGIPILLFAIWNVVGMLGNITSAVFLMDRFGRKRIFMVGIAGTAVCLCFEAALTKYYVQTGSSNKTGLGFGVFFIFLYVVFYATMIDAQQYVIVSETYPMEFRSIGVAVSLACQFAGAALFVGVAPTSFEHIGWKFYLVFICLDCLTFTLVWLKFPETKGLSLEEIGELFGDPVAVHITRTEEGEDDLDKRIAAMELSGKRETKPYKRPGFGRGPGSNRQEEAEMKAVSPQAETMGGKV